MPLQRSLRGIVVAPPGSAPKVAVDEAGTGRRIAATPRAVRTPSARMAAALKKRDVEVFPFVVEGLAPATEYAWRVDGARVGEPVSTLPTSLPREGASILAASCFFGYFEGAASAHLAALRSVARRERSLFRVMAGDNLYVDVAPSSTRFDDAYEETAERYAHYFARGACAEVLAAAPSCAAWDDHEFWNDFPERQPHLSRSWDEHFEDYRAAADEAIDLFQAPLNPPSTPGARCYAFDLAPLRFFVADSRTRRTRVDDATPRLMPEAELDALTTWLREAPDGPRVLVLGQPLWTGETSNQFGLRMDHNLPSFQRHYQRLLDALRESPFDVLVVSGDVHFSRLLRLEFPGGRGVYEFVTSPVCHVPSIASCAMNSATSLVGLDPDDDKVTLAGPPANFSRAPYATDWFFASGSPNSFGVLRFKPCGASVSVGGGFVDGARADAPWLAALAPLDQTVSDRRATSVCASDDLFVLRDR